MYIRGAEGRAVRVVYADTSALIALTWRGDQAHQRVHDHYLCLREARDVVLTSNLVLAETATRLRYDAGVRAAVFREFVERATATERLVVRYADAEVDRKAWAIMEKYADRALSFADCVGAVTAGEAAAGDVVGLEPDFVVVGFALEQSATGAGRRIRATPRRSSRSGGGSGASPGAG